MRTALIWAPLAAFAVLMWVVSSGLVKPAEREVRSALIGKPLPAFALPPSLPTKPGLTTAMLRQGRPRLLNVFASWCVPCAAEAPQLMALRRAGVPIDAIAIRDTPAAVAGFLARYGDPYARVGDDRASTVQLALGSSGVPETFVIDGRGVIVKQHVGDIRAEHVADLIAAVEAAR
jgi:cytochrome c biogenesis protein CcmG/thiol:disulfide interchange protein DsbE